MVVSGGGGEEEVFDTNFYPSFQGLKFWLGHLSNCSFLWYLKERERNGGLNVYKRFPPKDLEKFLLKSMIPNAHA